ncbi:Rieske (2Fe-2S) protein [Candidatus Uhrbacteria bacterium]|nr:Rieske (2Fe-2S) protein [Candidatus Uhrbacteria bacterium]
MGKVQEIAEGSVKKFKLGFRDALATRLGGKLKAYFDFCTHQGGKLRLENGEFHCLRHFSVFDAATGARTAGLAPEGSQLAEIPLVVEGDEVFAVQLISDF